MLNFGIYYIFNGKKEIFMSQITFILKADGIIADQIYIAGACNELGFTEENALPMMETS